MQKRIFVAINLPANLKLEIVNLQNKLKKFDWPVHWESPEKCHITLRFVGSISGNEIEKVSTIIKQAVGNTSSFTLIINNFIAFPNFKFPRVICLNIENSEQLNDLQAKIVNNIKEQGIGESERHPFSGHITIGRAKPLSANYRALKQFNFQNSFAAKSVDIMESILKDQDSEYTLIFSYKL